MVGIAVSVNVQDVAIPVLIAMTRAVRDTVSVLDPITLPGDDAGRSLSFAQVLPWFPTSVARFLAVTIFLCIFDLLFGYSVRLFVLLRGSSTKYASRHPPGGCARSYLLLIQV